MYEQEKKSSGVGSGRKGPFWRLWIFSVPNKVLTETEERNLDQFIVKARSLEPESLMMQYASLLAARDAYIVLQNQNLFFRENPDLSLAHLINKIHQMMKKEPEKFQFFFRQDGNGAEAVQAHG